MYRKKIQAYDLSYHKVATPVCPSPYRKLTDTWAEWHNSSYLINVSCDFYRIRIENSRIYPKKKQNSL